jgi:hypothetical protein
MWEGDEFMCSHIKGAINNLKNASSMQILKENQTRLTLCMVIKVRGKAELLPQAQEEETSLHDCCLPACLGPRNSLERGPRNSLERGDNYYGNKADGYQVSSTHIPTISLARRCPLMIKQTSLQVK